MQYETKIKKLPKSEIELQISLPANLLDEARKKALSKFCTSLEIDGFRKGHVPENVVLEKIGEATILDEAADILINEHFSKIIKQENLDIIGNPKVAITKLALGNPLEFKATITIMPEFKLPDYKKIAGEINKKEKNKIEKPEATEKEVAEVLLQIRKNKAHFDYHKTHKDEKDHFHGGIDLEKEENLPALDDELAKAAGSFKNLDELKEKIKQNLISEKEIRNEEKIRATIMEDLIKKTDIEVPEILIESEIQKSIAQMKGDIERSGMKWGEYLAHVKKTDSSAETLAKAEEDLKKDLRQSAEKKAVIQLIFNKIALEEKMEPNKEILENEVKAVMQHYPDADEVSARIYVSTILLNKEVLKLLEQQ